jgi:hypothetical protein
MSEKQSALKKLHAENKVKDKIIGSLLKEINAYKVPIPDYVVKTLQLIYRKKMIKNANVGIILKENEQEKQ